MPRPRTRTDAQVLDAALRAVSARGMAGLTLADVAREAGLAASTLAERFGSKRALLLAAARHAAGEVRLPEGDVVDALVALAAGVGDRAAFAHQLALLELDVSDPEFRAAAAEHAASVQAQLAARVGDAGLARALYVAYNGSLVLWALSGEGRLGDTLRADLEAVLVRSRSRGPAGPAAPATARAVPPGGPPPPAGCG
jgi:AcrR family transcriptional regulator